TFSGREKPKRKQDSRRNNCHDVSSACLSQPGRSANGNSPRPASVIFGFELRSPSLTLHIGRTNTMKVRARRPLGSTFSSLIAAISCSLLLLVAAGCGSIHAG